MKRKATLDSGLLQTVFEVGLRTTDL